MNMPKKKPDYYTYKKQKGWFPSIVWGWTRLDCSVKVFDSFACALREKPDNAVVVGICVSFKECSIKKKCNPAFPEYKETAIIFTEIDL
jgi:hypothetical protein